MYARDDYEKMGKGLNQQIYLGVVLLGAGALRCGVPRCGALRCGVPRCGALRCGALRCGACGCWCSWEIKRLKSHSPAYNILKMAPHFIVWVQGTLEGMVGR